MKHAVLLLPLAAWLAALPTPVAAAPSHGSLTLSVPGGRSFRLEPFGPAAAEAPPTGVRAVSCLNGRPEGRATEYRFNAILDEPAFATADDLFRWQQIYARREYRDPLKAPFAVRLSPDGGNWLLYLNGVYVARMPRDAAVPATPSVSATPGFPLAFNVAFDAPDPAFETVDITERANALGVGKAKLNLPCGAVTNVAGVPFRLSRDPRNDNVNLSMSWNPGESRFGYTACHANRRWPWPLSKTPLRYLFQVPGRDYDEIDVLCATDAGLADAVPRFTVQFYRKRNADRGSGRPFNFASPDVPAFGATNFAPALATASGDGLWLVRIPLSGDLTTELGPEDAMCFEITKEVEPYRTYPDPLNHSWHGSGLPSAVRVFGVTLRKAPVSLRFDPLQKANLFDEGETVGYRVTLQNNTATGRVERLALSARDWFAAERLSADAEVALTPGEEKSVDLVLKPTRFGWYEATLDGCGRMWRHTFVRLRERERDFRPLDAPGLRVGCTSMFGSPLRAYIAGKGGWDTGHTHTPPRLPRNEEERKAREETRAVMRRFGMHSISAPGSIRAQNGITASTPPAEAEAMYEKKLPDPANAPEDEFKTYAIVAALAEPGGLNTRNADFPEYYGEATNAYDWTKLDKTAMARYADYRRQIEAAAAVLRRRFPKSRLLLPHGNWNFLIPYLQNPETRNLFDGVEMDFQYYTRLPEEQMHQMSLNGVWYFRNAWAKYRGDTPFLIWGEGPNVTQVYPGGSTELSKASHAVRISMLMLAYGCPWQCGWEAHLISEGENHCSGGLVTGVHALDPDLAYAAFAAWTRKMRHAVHEGYTETGSTSAFCQNFRDKKSNGKIRAVWTVRGERPFVFDCPASKVTVYDPMDNIVPARDEGGKAVVVAGEMPVFVYGADDAVLSLGEPDHSDSGKLEPGAQIRDFGPLADHFGAQTDDADDAYVNMMPNCIKRFKAVMNVAVTNDPAAPERGAVISVGLPPQEVDRMVMPYFTCLTLKEPVAIPGKGAALRLDVKAASDWGRVVFVLKDAAGRRWYSCGRKGDFNADDMEGQSVFCFDGWRTLRFELPSNAPWTGFRNVGFTNWGADDQSLAARVALPVALEKVFVERRNGVMYCTDFKRFEKDVPVLLGRLCVEYACEADATDEPLRLQAIQAPKPPSASLVNPIADMAKANTLAPGKVVAVKDPDTWFDGTRGDFTFEMPPEAVEADVWVARHADGRGALRLAKGLKTSPALVRGFIAGVDFYAFLVWRDKNGNESKPSEPFAFRMEDRFGHQ